MIAFILALFLVIRLVWFSLFKDDYFNRQRNILVFRSIESFLLNISWWALTLKLCFAITRFWSLEYEVQLIGKNRHFISERQRLSMLVIICEKVINCTMVLSAWNRIGTSKNVQQHWLVDDVFLCLNEWLHLTAKPLPCAYLVLQNLALLRNVIIQFFKRQKLNQISFKVLQLKALIVWTRLQIIDCLLFGFFVLSHSRLWNIEKRFETLHVLEINGQNQETVFILITKWNLIKI